MHAFLQQVCEKYNLGKIKSWSKFRLGLINEKYYLRTTKGVFVVRISVRTRKQLMFEVGLLRHLKKLPVIKLMNYGWGKFISLYKGRPYIVYKFIDGQLPKRITPALVKQLGVFQAKFHRLGNSFKSKINREPYTYNFPEIKIETFRKILQSKIPKEFVGPYGKITNILLNIKLPKQIPTGPIHVDIKPENILIKNNKLVGVLDFDNGYIGPYIIDIGKTITWFCIKKGKLNAGLLNDFFKSYQKIRKLTSMEKKFFRQALVHAVASHIFLDYYKYHKRIIPLSYLKMLHKEFYPFLSKYSL